MAGCSSLHVDMSPRVDWNQVAVLQFQGPPGDRWGLTQPIKAELLSMGFQVGESQADADLLFNYFTQESPDLTAESEVLLRLTSLHIEFIDPATQTRVTAVDYFYPATTNPAAPETGVKEVFSGLRQQMHQTVSAASERPAIEPVQAEMVEMTEMAATIAPTAPEPSQALPAEQLNQEASPPAPEIRENKPHQTIQRTDSPWLPRFKSWGFENWGQNSSSDY